MAKRINWTEQLISIVTSLYDDGHSPFSISKQLGFGGDAVCNLLKRLGLYQGRRSYCTERHYRLEDRYFECLDNEHKAYWLGFLAADGCVETHRVISLQIKSEDEEHLSRFLKAVGSDKPIYHSVKKGLSYSRITLNSSRLVADLMKHGVHPQKSLTLRWPDLPGVLIPHFVRGYFDGDGMWHKSNDNQLVFGVTGSPEFIPCLQQVLISHCEIRESKLVGNKSKTLQKKGNRQARRIYKYLYEGATIWLPRKRVIADTVLGISNPNTFL